jgi:hypothetical protein
MSTKFRGALAMGLILAVAPAVWAQSLADVARQEEARRKTIKAPAKVYTNDDLRDAGSPPQATPATAPSSGTQAGTAPTATPPSPSGTDADKPATPAPSPQADEAAWKQRMSTARDNLTRAQTFAEALQSRINALATDFAARSDPAQRAVISTDRQKALAELDRVKQEIQQYEKSITDIQEEARKAGVPAGWVR